MGTDEVFGQRLRLFDGEDEDGNKDCTHDTSWGYRGSGMIPDKSIGQRLRLFDAGEGDRAGDREV